MQALPKTYAGSCFAVFAVAALAGAWAPSANAEVIKSPAQNVPIPYDFSGVTVNVVTGETGDDVFIPGGPGYVMGWDLNLYAQTGPWLMTPFEVDPATNNWAGAFVSDPLYREGNTKNLALEPSCVLAQMQVAFRTPFSARDSRSHLATSALRGWPSTTRGFGPKPSPGCCKGLCGRGLRRDLEAPSSAEFMAARAARFVN